MTSDRSSDTEKPRVADRFALQQSWWIASEIARRHGTLLVSRVEDAEGYGLLIVHRGPVGERVQFDLPQGALWESAGGVIERLSWREIVSYDNPHRAVRRIEAACGFGEVKQAALTYPRTVVYRVAAAILAAKIDDRHSWQVTPAPLVTNEVERNETIALLATFPSTADSLQYAFFDIAEMAEHAAATQTTPYWHEPFWVVSKDLQPAFILDEAGYAHLPDGLMLNLLSLYKLLDRDVASVAGVVLMPPGAALATAVALES